MKILQNVIILIYKNGEKREVDSLKAIEGTVIERRQNLLDKLVMEELRDLKKLVFKFKHRQLLENKLSVTAVNIQGENHIGLYRKMGTQMIQLDILTK
ncbi:hypothetical protein LL037_18775 [Clostridium estertheticum]|uniref:hypothetical protein n=1 Tax=Clostridium estertheticum TaxID=238834 RepID=UPI001C0D7AFD|nr:hypothetical protein [Clostridium estertheticum]MBU3198514.1 hypothetical protein [Clostridium estertheticum]WAG64495.1 hypothetical protein LL037_18775 [Clostridium estertheticum]